MTARSSDGSAPLTNTVAAAALGTLVALRSWRAAVAVELTVTSEPAATVPISASLSDLKCREKGLQGWAEVETGEAVALLVQLPTTDCESSVGLRSVMCDRDPIFPMFVRRVIKLAAPNSPLRVTRLPEI